MIQATDAPALSPAADLGNLVLRVGLNLGLATIIILFIYNRRYRNRDYVFTYYVLNLITFSLCFLLGKVPAHLGLGLALFGVFGILRYRTEQIAIRDLTYFFIVIGMGVLNGVASKTVGLTELMVINGLIVGVTAILELASFKERDDAIEIHYDQLELLRPGNEPRLHSDLRNRTGLAVQRVKVRTFDLLRDSAEITVFYRERPE